MCCSYVNCGWLYCTPSSVGDRDDLDIDFCLTGEREGPRHLMHSYRRLCLFAAIKLKLGQNVSVPPQALSTFRFGLYTFSRPLVEWGRFFGGGSNLKKRGADRRANLRPCQQNFTFQRTHLSKRSMPPQVLNAFHPRASTAACEDWGPSLEPAKQRTWTPESMLDATRW